MVGLAIRATRRVLEIGIVAVMIERTRRLRDEGKFDVPTGVVTVSSCPRTRQLGSISATHAVHGWCPAMTVKFEFKIESKRVQIPETAHERTEDISLFVQATLCRPYARFSQQRRSQSTEPTALAVSLRLRDVCGCLVGPTLCNAEPQKRVFKGQEGLGSRMLNTDE